MIYAMYPCGQVIRVGAIVGLGNPDVTYCVKDVLISHDLSQGQPNLYLSHTHAFPKLFVSLALFTASQEIRIQVYFLDRV